MNVISLTTLVFLCGALSARAASHCGTLGDPAYHGSSLMAQFSNSPGVCTTTTTTTVLTTTVVGATMAPTTKAATTKAPTTKAPTTKAPTTLAPTTKAPTTLAPTTVTTTVTTVTATSTNTTTTTTTTTVTATSTNTTTTTSTTTVTATSTNTTTTTTTTTVTATSTNTTITTTPTPTSTTTSNSTTTTVTATSTNTTTVTTTTVTETTTNFTTTSTNSSTTTTTTTVTATSTNTTTTTTTTTVTGTTTNTTFTTSTTITTATVTTTNVTTPAPTTTIVTTTIVTTTLAPTTKAPTTLAPTPAPTTTAAPTPAPTTKAPTTKAPTTTVTVTTGCATAACAPPLLAPSCGNIAAGQTKSCTISAGALMTDCMPTKASYACPSNNMDINRQPDFVQEGGVKCKTCSTTTNALTISDKDPVSGMVWVSLTWGPLMSSSGVFKEDDVKLYRIFVVDSKGRIIGNAIGDAIKAPTESSCCISDLYSASVAGALPTGYERFMVVPVVMIGGSEVYLPMGLLTDIIVDNDAGVATKVKGSFKLQVANAAAFKTDPAVKDSLRAAIADTIDGVDKELVRILNVTEVTSRRLRETANRRLATEVKVDYEIILPEDYAGPPVTATSIPKAALQTNINTRIAENPAISASMKTQFVATVTSVEAPVENSIGTARATGGARRNRPLGFCSTLIAMATALGMLGFVQ